MDNNLQSLKDAKLKSTESFAVQFILSFRHFHSSTHNESWIVAITIISAID